MIDLESETPFVHWTSDGFNSTISHQTVARAVWHHSPILSYAIADARVTFDGPPEWGGGASPICLRKTPSGNYTYHTQGTWLKSVRAETPTHVIMTGWWSALRSGGTGVFIAVLPLQRSQIALKKMAETTAVENYA